jgi:hypothetical protein
MCRVNSIHLNFPPLTLTLQWEKGSMVWQSEVVNEPWIFSPKSLPFALSKSKRALSLQPLNRKAKRLEIGSEKFFK